MTQHVHVDPVQLIGAAKQIDVLADQLERSVGNQARTLGVQPAGTDEVSVRAAGTFSEVAKNYSDETTRGVLELRKVAAVLRSQAGEFTSADETVEQAFKL